MTYDVVTMGEVMLRFTPPDNLRVEQADFLQVHVAGSEANTAVGLSRLGLRVSYITRLTDNYLGHRIANAAREQGVDTSHIVWTDEDRVGVYFFEEAVEPRPSLVLYDRKNSAASKMQPKDLPDIFTPGGARLFHVSGITVGISESSAETVRAAVQRAKAAGWQISFDLNYRAALWTYEKAEQVCDEFFAAADLLFFPIRDAIQVFQCADGAAPATVTDQIAARYPNANIVLTLGEDGAICRTKAGQYWEQPAYQTTTRVGRIGGGDAFNAGFLCSYLQDGMTEAALKWGAASAALKYTLPGDFPLIRRVEVERLIAQGRETVTLRR